MVIGDVVTLTGRISSGPDRNKLWDSFSTNDAGQMALGLSTRNGTNHSQQSTMTSLTDIGKVSTVEKYYWKTELPRVNTVLHDRHAWTHLRQGYYVLTEPQLIIDNDNSHKNEAHQKSTMSYPVSRTHWLMRCCSAEAQPEHRERLLSVSSRAPSAHDAKGQKFKGPPCLDEASTVRRRLAGTQPWLKLEVNAMFLRTTSDTRSNRLAEEQSFSDISRSRDMAWFRFSFCLWADGLSAETPLLSGLSRRYNSNCQNGERKWDGCSTSHQLRHAAAFNFTLATFSDGGWQTSKWAESEKAEINQWEKRSKKPMRASDVDDGATRISGWFKPSQTDAHTPLSAPFHYFFPGGTLDAAMTMVLLSTCTNSTRNKKPHTHTNNSGPASLPPPFSRKQASIRLDDLYHTRPPLTPNDRSHRELFLQYYQNCLYLFNWINRSLLAFSPGKNLVITSILSSNRTIRLRGFQVLIDAGLLCFLFSVPSVFSSPHRGLTPLATLTHEDMRYDLDYKPVSSDIINATDANRERLFLI
ncbi:hypothetical protein CEK26_000239 [Fusarium fujikuroi]|nr:hypothetical protein CEK26_000239 [Fusarium fujikuroi]